MAFRPPLPVSTSRLTAWLSRALTLCVVALCLAGQGTSALHFALVEHVRCAEHASVEHRDEHRHSEPAEHAEGQQVQADADDHAHRECRALAITTEPPLPLQDSFVALSYPSVSGGVSSDASSHCRLSLWMLAPKTSPPS